MQELAKAIATAPPHALAELVSEMPRERLRELAVEPLRTAALTRLFTELPEHVDPALAADLHGTVAWDVTGGADGRVDRYLMLVSGGRCRLDTDGGDGAEPTVTVHVEPADLLRLATGNADIALLVLAGDLVLGGDERFALRLVRALRLPTVAGVAAPVDPRKVDASAVARLVGELDDRVLRQRLRAGVRQLLVEEIFERMPNYFRPAGADGVEAVIAWRITGRADGADDCFLLRITQGTCRVDNDTTDEPAVSLRVEPLQFLKLVTSNANPMASFVTGKLSVRGDFLLAARIPSMFTIPHA